MKPACERLAVSRRAPSRGAGAGVLGARAARTSGAGVQRSHAGVRNSEAARWRARGRARRALRHGTAVPRART